MNSHSRLKNPTQQKKLTYQGRLAGDAIVAELAIRFPTDLSLLNEALEFSEQIIDLLVECLLITLDKCSLSGSGAVLAHLLGIIQMRISQLVL